MSKVKRIALSIDPEYHALLTYLAKAQNKTVTSVVTDFLEGAMPVALAMKKAFEDIELGKDQEEVLQQLMKASLEAAATEFKKP